ncbi:hypothetical protein DSO57_1018106 [Entomophthora muscae]|uniref:Uncharacterized protein n=1 Tax=Entomophthora muscae TaxID=34485 RepID=A0ACC2TRP5_9FUNG|nr:hypothetical protein DSO57_1018106 [Entomophthora muscae]
MNHLIFTAVLTACLGIGGYQQGPEFFGPSPEGLGQNYHYDPGQLNSSNTGSWPPPVSPHSDLFIEVYTSLYCVLTYFAGSFGGYNIHAKAFWWSMTIYPTVTALTGFRFSNLQPYLLQIAPTMSGYGRFLGKGLAIQPVSNWFLEDGFFIGHPLYLPLPWLLQHIRLAQCLEKLWIRPCPQ